MAAEIASREATGSPRRLIVVDRVVCSLKCLERELFNICFGSDVVNNGVVAFGLDLLQLVHKFDRVNFAFFVCRMKALGKDLIDDVVFACRYLATSSSSEYT